MKKDLSVSMVKANLYAVFAALPFIVILVGVDIYVGQRRNYFDELFSLEPKSFSLFMLAIFIGVIIHELIHGITWQFFSKKKSNAIRYGIDWKTMSPYAHCKEPMEIKAYRLGAVMPAIILGFLPAIVGILTGNSFIFIFGLVFILAAGGDILILWLIRNVKAGSLVEDHPKRAGCYVIDGNEV
ncbi:hypothetical protein Riv7116_0606 [Rivularia sp. PCC 7116]|uniref:DUF3267 domain-containing protein n=1 Tax=Rivularia sp. PCC 7116 TaxID=373994 RepID=UPI00029EFA4F|nr:DUF3267 domain-containing protein [Rivularia sp. PCC 7116]AFY53200.1 hypothetical protein Riv7116_0606 [Rivularia sp. PCC 7116]